MPIVRSRPLTPDARRRARTRRAIFWTAAASAAIAVLGLVFFPSVRLVWIVLLIFAVAAVPQGIALTREPRSRRRK